VFALTTVTWNRDSRDWAIPYLFSQTVEKSIDEVRSYVNGSKSPGMNILEHELNGECVAVFEGVYGDYVSNGWDIRNLVSRTRC
jgi:chitin deacetylase